MARHSAQLDAAGLDESQGSLGSGHDTSDRRLALAVLSDEAVSLPRVVSRDRRSAARQGSLGPRYANANPASGAQLSLAIPNSMAANEG